MYPFLTLVDDTEITHSEMKPDGKVKVYIETPDEKDGFHNATCWLLDYRWEDINGYFDKEIEALKELVKNNAHLIMEFLAKGGFKTPQGFKIGNYIVYFWSNEGELLEPVNAQKNSLRMIEANSRIIINKWVDHF